MYRHYRVADGEFGDAGADGGDRAGKFMTEGGRQRDFWVTATIGFQIGAAGQSGVDIDLV